jgi:hypothetical protein
MKCFSKKRVTSFETYFASVFPMQAKTLMVSKACNEPIMPTMGPKMPESEQLDTVSGGGATGYKQR